MKKFIIELSKLVQDNLGETCTIPFLNINNKN